MLTDKFRSFSLFHTIFSCIKTRVLRKHSSQNDLVVVKSHRICSTHDVVDHVLSFLDKSALVHCTLVNKQWNSIATPFLWQCGANNGVQTILQFVDTHYESQELDPIYKKHRHMLRYPPCTTSWRRVEFAMAPFVHSLTLDFKSLITSQWLLDELLQSCPTRIKLPRLTRLKVIINHDATEIGLVSKFMQRSITHFTAELWEPLPTTRRALHTMQREACRNVPCTSRYEEDVFSPAFPLPSFFHDIAQSMPDLNYLALDIHDDQMLFEAWNSFVTLLVTLQGLHTVRLPPYALPEALARAVGDHPKLRSILAYEEDPEASPRLEPYLERMSIISTVTATGHAVPVYLQDLALTCSPSDAALILSSDAFRSANITSLHLHFSGYIPLDLDMTAIFRAVACHSSSLQVLKMGPLVYPESTKPFRLTYDILRPLTACRRLVTLDIRAAYTSNISEDEFEHLVSRWGSMQHLVLDYPDVRCTAPDEVATLSLPAVLDLLSKYCPALALVALYLSPTSLSFPLSSYKSSSIGTSGLANLRELSICVGLPVIDIDEYTIHRLGHLASLRSDIHWELTSPIMIELDESFMGWEKRRLDLLRFILRTRYELTRLAGRDCDTVHID